MSHDSHEHEYWNRPPVRTPRGDELDDDPRDVKTYEDHNERYFEKHGSEDESIPIGEVGKHSGQLEVDEEFVKNHEGPVGQLQWEDSIDDSRSSSTDLTEYEGLRECSGTLIADDLFLTAGHCFVIDGGPPPAHVARRMHVNFDYQGDSEGVRYGVVELEELVFQHAGLDYAILELQGDPGAEYGTAAVAGEDARKDDTVCIIGHPNGLPKRVVTGRASHLHDVRIGYDNINTAPGSSGAGILRADGRLVGVHSESGIGINEGHNHGIRISAILNVSPTLRDYVGGPIRQYAYESHSAMTDSRRSTLEPEDDSYGGTELEKK